MLKLKTYVKLWIALSIILLYEYWALNFNPSSSLLSFLKHDLKAFPHISLNPSPGKGYSLYLGWIGFGIMCLTNLYILRKHIHALRTWGKISRWLDFHIFCGLVGPTFILFHTNFKVGGLVAISFWSMVISFASGIVGRYFYMQLVGQKTELEAVSHLHEQFLDRLKAEHPAYQNQDFTPIKQKAIALAGGYQAGDHSRLLVLRALFYSLTGDLRLSWGIKGLTKGLPVPFIAQIKKFAVTRRRILYLEEFRKMMGYWHSFHMPFAVFMYIVAVIHIASALLFQVSEM